MISILNGASTPTRLDHTHVVLLLKKQNSIETTDFCPISLCNVIYKLVTKVITNRLKEFLPSLMSDNQTAFAHELSFQVEW